jgi:flagellar hook assembly protein FlgD
MLLALVDDESGINTTGAGIGHDIMATLTGPTRNAYSLNDYFVADLDQPGKGSITYKMQDLADGDYTLTLKVWDIYNNSSTASIDFTVVNNSGMVIENAFNAPNPVTDETHFVFDHNQVGNNVKVDIYIYDIMGRWVNTISETVSGASTRTDPIRWNGCGAGGASLRNGVYIYRIVATNDNGETATLVSKLVLSK